VLIIITLKVKRLKTQSKSISTYRVENSNAKNYEIIKIDGCVFKSDETKCDYAMRLIEEKKYFL
jgi:hypothetical protein